MHSSRVLSLFLLFCLACSIQGGDAGHGNGQGKKNTIQVELDTPEKFKAIGRARNAKITVGGDEHARGRMKDVVSEKDDLIFEIGDKTISFTVIKDSLATGSVSITGPSEGLKSAELEEIREMCDDIYSFEESTRRKGNAPKNARIGLGAKLCSWLAGIPAEKPIVSRTMSINVKRADDSRLTKTDLPRRRLLATCYGEFSPDDQANPEPYCPQTLTGASPGDDGQTCMCDVTGLGYDNTGVYPAWYDDDRNGKTYQWWRRWGEGNDQCSGRCGAGCNWFDEEAFVDCFDHDSCVGHLGGATLYGDRCNDETWDAMDDYTASYGWGCC